MHYLGHTYAEKILIVYGKFQPNWRPGLDLTALDVSSFGVSAISCLFLQCCKPRRKGGAGGGGQGCRAGPGVGSSAGGRAPWGQHRKAYSAPGCGGSKYPHTCPSASPAGAGAGALAGRQSMAPSSRLRTHREPADWCVCGIKSSKWSFKVKARVRVSFFKSRGDFPVAQWLQLHAPSAGGLGSIPGQGTRSHVHAATKDPAFQN